MADGAHPFTDPVSGRDVVLHLVDGLGVAHGDCPVLADVLPEIDAFYCPACRWNGRISGAWFTGLVAASRKGDDGQ